VQQFFLTGGPREGVLGENGTAHTKEYSMRKVLWGVAALGGLAMFATAVKAQSPYYYDHERYHDELEHRAYHRYLEQREAHRYPMTWRDHEWLHDALDHEAFHDRLEHREYHRQYDYVPYYSYGRSFDLPYPAYGALGYGSCGGFSYVPYPGYGMPGYGIGIQGPHFSLYIGR
jgi:hypothetical protein